MNKLIISVAVTTALLAGCDGDNGTNGTNGSDGSNGLNSLVNTTTLAVGNSHCPNGGLQTDTGLDLNRDGLLSSDEVSQTSYACVAGSEPPQSDSMLTNTTSNNWYRTEAANVASAIDYQALRGQAKNVILFVGDGMGVSTVTAARILAGQLNGGLGEEHRLAFETLPYAGFAKTYNVDAQTPDSAGTMTAIMSGVKTDVGVIGVDEDIVRGDCSSVSGNELISALELAEIGGKSTGIISSARITHATPAATYAKSADRNWEDISDMPQAAIDAGCEDIASQLVNFETNLEARYAGLEVDGLEVVMGGGRRHFLPKDANFNSPDARSSTEGDRTDGRDLTAEWQARYPDGSYVFDKTGFNGLDTESSTHIFGLFNESHMQYEADRNNDIAGEPSLRAMTSKAIEVLDNNDEGFFLMVESGRIDHGHHAGSAYAALTDTIELDEAVAAAMAMTNPEETLIIVTADHSHVFTIAGYPKRGNPILGKVVPVGSDAPSLAKDGMPYTTVGYTNGRGFADLGSSTDADDRYDMDVDAGRQDLLFVDSSNPGFHQESLVPRSSETHAAEDVSIHASGPGAALLTGTNEQQFIFHAIDYAADLSRSADAILN
ncbi:alkaline phosphatase [uncultured Ferrimonas sp.]|uniref:alkaline phosphatase n=1 Tax=uncultured Ferrimonas sp. TaxID=432640 RepID=UPI002617788A|nr:alkaline phosphatase [uncultured Ferrimonas sp.]